MSDPKPDQSSDRTDAPETVEVEETTVACDGGPLGHPKVYLSLGDNGTVDCPYCDRRFVLKPGAATAGH
jgi:uncharacterized Zn-finger protein